MTTKKEEQIEYTSDSGTLGYYFYSVGRNIAAWPRPNIVLPQEEQSRIAVTSC